MGEEVKVGMYEYGRHLGLAFQVVDDILDFTQTQEQLGKPQVGPLPSRERGGSPARGVRLCGASDPDAARLDFDLGTCRAELFMHLRFVSRGYLAKEVNVIYKLLILCEHPMAKGQDLTAPAHLQASGPLWR